MRRTGRPNPRATREWLSSWNRTETYSSTTNAAATTYRTPLEPASAALFP